MDAQQPWASHPGGTASQRRVGDHDRVETAYPLETANTVGSDVRENQCSATVPIVALSGYVIPLVTTALWAEGGGLVALSTITAQSEQRTQKDKQQEKS
jgi:hypothetical protein